MPQASSAPGDSDPPDVVYIKKCKVYTHDIAVCIVGTFIVFPSMVTAFFALL